MTTERADASEGERGDGASGRERGEKDDPGVGPGSLRRNVYQEGVGSENVLSRPR